MCTDEEVRAKMMDLKHKHDAIMKGQDKHKNTLQRRVSSTGSRGWGEHKATPHSQNKNKNKKSLMYLFRFNKKLLLQQSSDDF